MDPPLRTTPSSNPGRATSAKVKKEKKKKKKTRFLLLLQMNVNDNFHNFQPAAVYPKQTGDHSPPRVKSHGTLRC